MRILKTLLATAFVAAAGLGASAIGDIGVADAAAHVKKGKPGKCGTYYYYSKKDKGCISKQG